MDAEFSLTAYEDLVTTIQQWAVAQGVDTSTAPYMVLPYFDEWVIKEDEIAQLAHVLAQSYIQGTRNNHEEDNKS